jgi:uncharacterized BrkB/YihY/UPF0761 family membrane protein
MKQNNSTKDKKNSKKPNVTLFLFVIPILLLILLTIVTVIGVYLIEQNTRGSTPQFIGLATLGAIIAVVTLLIATWTIYYSIRYFQIPAWRWIAGGFKGKPDFPHTRLMIRKSKDTKHYKEMNKIERICMLMGYFCTFSGIVLLFIGVLWFLVLDITHESIVDSISLTLFCVGALLYFLGVFINYICTRKDTKRGDSVVSK